MKKLFLLFTLFICFGVRVSASTVNEGSNDSCMENTTVPSHYILWATVHIPEIPTSFPYVISVPAPPERVTDVNGPVRPNVSWNIQGGMLNIYLGSMDIDEFSDTHIIEIATSPMKYYYIELCIN